MEQVQDYPGYATDNNCYLRSAISTLDKPTIVRRNTKGSYRAVTGPKKSMNLKNDSAMSTGKQMSLSKRSALSRSKSARTGFSSKLSRSVRSKEGIGNRWYMDRCKWYKSVPPNGVRPPPFRVFNDAAYIIQAAVREFVDYHDSEPSEEIPCILARYGFDPLFESERVFAEKDKFAEKVASLKSMSFGPLRSSRFGSPSSTVKHLFMSGPDQRKRIVSRVGRRESPAERRVYDRLINSGRLMPTYSGTARFPIPLGQASSRRY